MPVRIRTLTPEDAPVYRELRLRALQEHPEAFATSYEEELARPEAEVASRLASASQQMTLGAFDQDRLVGIATLLRPTKAKLKHRAGLVAMYVAPEARGQRLGRTLLERAIAVAHEWEVSDVGLAVTVGNHAARKLYADTGFVSYGIEPRSLSIEGHFHDVELMNLQLR